MGTCLGRYIDRRSKTIFSSSSPSFGVSLPLLVRLLLRVASMRLRMFNLIFIIYFYDLIFFVFHFSLSLYHFRLSFSRSRKISWFVRMHGRDSVRVWAIPEPLHPCRLSPSTHNERILRIDWETRHAGSSTGDVHIFFTSIKILDEINKHFNHKIVSWVCTERLVITSLHIS